MGKRQPIRNVDRTDWLRSCRKQGIMGAGTVFAQRPSPAQAEAWSRPPLPFPIILPPKSLPETYPSAGP